MSDLEQGTKWVIRAGLSTGHADSWLMLLDEVLDQYIELREKYRKGVQWFSRESGSPPSAEGEYILIFSPDYPRGDPMRMRIVQGQFWPYRKEATHWAYLPEPPNERS